jgi:hypothetical protein
MGLPAQTNHGRMSEACDSEGPAQTSREGIRIQEAGSLTAIFKPNKKTCTAAIAIRAICQGLRGHRGGRSTSYLAERWDSKFRKERISLEQSDLGACVREMED